MSASVSSPGRPAEQAGHQAGGFRLWFAVAGAAIVVVSLLPPVETLALRYVVAETIQFLVFALVAPALIVRGAPWRLLRLSRDGGGAAPGGTGLADRLAAARRTQRSFRRAGLLLVAFMAVTVLWRLPPIMDALSSHPALIAAELVSLMAVGIALWLELLASPPLAPRLSRLQRAAIAAFAMWFTWAVAYMIGFHNGAFFSTYGSAPGRALSLVADQEIAVALTWVTAGLCFIPLIIINMLGWLRDGEDTEEELQRMVRDSGRQAVVKGWASPGKGWGQAPPGGRGQAG